MQLTLRQQLTQFGHILQQQLFPVLEDELGPLTPSAKLLVAILNLAPLRRFIPVAQGWNGRPAKDRYAIACAFLAKTVYNLLTPVKNGAIPAGFGRSQRLDTSLSSPLAGTR